MRISESDQSHLGTVIQRWETVIKYLTTFSRYYPELAIFMESGGIFDKHYTCQVQPIHITAYCLNPMNRQLNHKLHQNPYYQKQLFEFFISHSVSSEHVKQVRIEDIYYTNQHGLFNRNEPLWEYIDNPQAFWFIAIRLGKQSRASLAQLVKLVKLGKI